MYKMTSQKNKHRINMTGLYLLGGIFVVFAFVLVMVQANVRYSLRKEILDLLTKEELAQRKAAQENRIENIAALNNLEVVTNLHNGSQCLFVVEEDDAISAKAQLVYIPVLSQMKEAYDICNVFDFDSGMLSQYDKLVLGVTHYAFLENSIADIKSWVKKGGNLMIAYPPIASGCFETLFDILGIKDCGNATYVDCLHFNKEFMIGSGTNDFPILDASDSSLGLSLTSDCEVYLQSKDEYPVPLIWRKKTGEGSTVFNNFGIMEKAYRGIHCAAYSLLGDFCVYPVINGATFYIDDFPSPIPEGNAQYITRDYNVSISDFYSQIWWNDIYDLSKKHGMHLTGLVIENYNDQVSGVFKRNMDIRRFQYFGNMLLGAGGEIGIHGYNHMPLVLENFDYKDQYDSYVQWPSIAEMEKGLNEVFAFTKSLFPKEELQVYVPPSNVLSVEGRKLLADSSIRAIASVYLSVDMAYEQEFDVSAEDGIINTPRITSGCIIDDYMKLAALSELNFHFVNTHFVHPDDVLDEDRGAEIGWEKMFHNLENYMDWLYQGSPDIRNLTGSELAAAVWRYDLTGVQREYDEKHLTIKLDQFDKEEWMLLRLNGDKKIEDLKGAQYKKVAEDLYLIECRNDMVEIDFE